MIERPDLVQKYEDILESNGTLFGITEANKKIAKIIETVPNLAGEHLGSVCRYQTIQFENGKKLELFVKQMPENSVHMEQLKEFNVFARESNFFNVLLKDLQEIWLERSGSNEPMDFFPKCFYSDDKEIILENLVKAKGYHLNSKIERQNLEYATMTIQNLATFHAVCYVLLKDIGETLAFSKYPCIKEVLFTSGNPMMPQMMENTKSVAVELLNNFELDGGNNALKTLEIYSKDLAANIVNLIGPKSNHMIRTIGHGDCWNNNMMFLKDQSTGQLKHQMLVDFQCTRIASPSVDLGYFMFTSIQPEIRKKYWKQILEAYFNKFQDIFKLITKKQAEFTFEEFVEDFKSKSLLGFWMGISFSTVMEVLATADASKMQGDFVEFFKTSIAKWVENNPEKTRGKAEEIVEFCAEYENFINA